MVLGVSDEWLYSGGLPHPKLNAGSRWRSESGSAPDQMRIKQVAKLLGRPVKYKGDDEYEHEILAASPIHPNGEFSYVSSEAKMWDGFVNIIFEFAICKKTLPWHEVSYEIETANPFYGCRVRFLEWVDDLAVLIYEEKETSYIAAAGIKNPVRYVAIENDWEIQGNQIFYRNGRETYVRSLSIPQLENLEPMCLVKALNKGLSQRLVG